MPGQWRRNICGGIAATAPLLPTVACAGAMFAATGYAIAAQHEQSNARSKPSTAASSGAAPSAATPSSTTTAESALAPPDLARGAEIFAQRCAVCHGPAGEGGRGPILATPRLLRVSASDEEALTALIRRGISGTEMPRSGLAPDELRHLVAFVAQLGQRPAEPVPGDARRGEELYRTKGTCVACHAIGGRGGAFGPDLTEIGRRRGAAYLRAALTEPEANVPKAFSMYRADASSLPENFLQVRVVTRDGRQLLGVRVNEDSFTIQIREGTGQLHSFFKSELTELHRDWGRSPMPSFAAVFSKEELDDVVAFLMSLKGSVLQQGARSQ